MRNISSLISKVRAAFMAATIAVVGVCASAPVQVNASTGASSMSNKALQFAEADFGGYLDRANDGVGMSNAQTAKAAFEFANQGADVSGEDWRFNASAGDYHFVFMAGEVTTGGYATGATIDVFVNDESLFTASRDGDQVTFGFNNGFDLDDYSSTTTPFILTGQVSWGVETISSADLALACALYDFIVAEDAASQPTTIEPVMSDTIDGLYEFITNGDLGNDFVNLRNEANNGVTNGWTEFSDAKSMIPNSNGLTKWQSGLWTVSVFGQKLTNTGLEQGIVTATYVPTGSLLRFSFTEDGSIKVAKKKGGLYGDNYTTSKIDSPDRYGVINFTNGEKIDTELLALAAAVDQYCSSAPRG